MEANALDRVEPHIFFMANQLSRKEELLLHDEDGLAPWPF